MCWVQSSVLEQTLDPGAAPWAGGEDGCICVFDLAIGEHKASFLGAGDTLNGAHFHPSLPLLATASGASVSGSDKLLQMDMIHHRHKGCL